MDAKPRFFPTPKACDHAGVGRSTLYEWGSLGYVKAVKAGRKTLWDTESLDRHLDTLKPAALRKAA
jgi:predicted site-specific integrase-resolvase